MNAEIEPNSKPQANRCAPVSGDLASGLRLWLIWILPILVLSFTGTVRTPDMDRAVTPYLVVIWPVLLTFMGGACLYNARGSKRLHCYITGPFFLLLAVASLFYGLGWLPLGPHGWNWLADVLIFGSIVLTCVPEWLFGKYTHRSAPKL